MKLKLLYIPAMIAVYLCAALDSIPAYEGGHTDPDTGEWCGPRWYRHGEWGCRIGLSKLWARWT